MNLTEQKLVQKILDGNPRAFKQFVELYKGLVSSIVYRMIDNDYDREDICQDVFVKCYKNINGFKFQCKLSTWVGKITYNTCVNYLKKLSVDLYEDFSAEWSIDNYKSESIIPSEDFDRESRKEMVHSAIMYLPVNYRTILTMYHLQELSYIEIGEILELPEGTVKNYLFRARKMLKDMLVKSFSMEEFLP